MPESQLDNNLDSEANRHAFVLRLFSIVGLSITATMAIVAIFEQRYILGTTLLAFSAAFLIAFASQQKTKSTKAASIITTFSLYSLIIYLVYSAA